MAELTLRHIAAIRSGNYTPAQLADTIESMLRSHNHVSQQVNASPVGTTPPPAPHLSNSVVGGGGILDVSVQDNPAYRGGEHFFDYTSDGWKTVHTKSIGPAKNWRGSLGNGTFEVRTYTSHSTSEPSAMLYAGKVTTTGGNAPPMQAGQGSGTGTAGYGQLSYVGPVPPKRG